MPTTTGTYTTGLKDGTNGIDLGKFLIEQAYVTAVSSFLSPSYFAPLAEKSGFAFVSGGITYNLDDIYVRNDYWRQGNLLLWGSNGSGRLGNNTVTSSSSPIQTVTGGINWKEASCGTQHTAAIKSDGTLWCWGANGSGQLGDNTVTARSSPVQTVSSTSNWWQVSCGEDFTAAIKNDGTLWCWGSNQYGNLGDNTTVSKSSPVQTVAGGSTWKQVSAGFYSTAAIKSDNTLWLWGFNFYGQLGNGSTTNRSSPTQVSGGGTTWKQVACGEFHTMAIKTDNTLWGCGYNQYGQMGNAIAGSGTSFINFTQCTQGNPVNNWKWVAAGRFHSAAIKRDGTLWSFGWNSSGQLGDNSTTARSSPVQTIAAGTNWKQLSCGQTSTHAIKTDGTLWSWGSPASILGDLTAVSKSSPVQTAIGGTAWRKVSSSARAAHALALDYNDQPASIIVPAPPPSTPACWVARLVYGENNPDWMVFRDWMLKESPIWFKNTYLGYGERFANFIKNKPAIKFVVRKLMDLVVKNKKS